MSAVALGPSRPRSAGVLPRLLAVGGARSRRRLELVAQAAHELRGSAATIALAAATLRREPGGIRRALAFEAEIERMRGGLADLDCARARAAGRPVAGARAARASPARSRGGVAARRAPGRPTGSLRLGWRAGGRASRQAPVGPGLLQPRGKRGRARLGAGRAEGSPGRVATWSWRCADRGPSGRVQGPGPATAPDPDRGRGVAIASRAVEEAGGRLAVDSRPDGTTAAIELPARRAVTAPVRRRRAALLLSLALACGGLAASQVASRVREVDARVGAPGAGLVTARDVGSGRSLRAGDLEVRQVPERFVPPDALDRRHRRRSGPR